MSVAIEETGKSRVGIKHPNFHPGRTNGVSHRQNKMKKDAQHRKNVQIRADLYASMQGEAANRDKRWHITLDALSKGTA